MANETRGSDKLSTICDDTRQLSSEEIEQVAGGIATGGSAYFDYRPFPRGIPWPELLNDRMFDPGSMVQDLNQSHMR